MIVTIEKKHPKPEDDNFKKINIVAKHNIDDSRFDLFAISDDKQEMGKLCFYVEQTNNRIWLNHIETNKAFKRQGVGSALLTAMEYISLRNFKITKIDGVFNPKLPVTAITQKMKKEIINGTANFYARNNYDIVKCNNGSIIKCNSWNIEQLKNLMLTKKITKPLSEYNKMIDCSYYEIQNLKIDFDSIYDKMM